MATPAAAPPAMPVEVPTAPALRPTSAVTAQNDDDVVEVPVPRARRAPRRHPRPLPRRSPRRRRLPMTGFDLGLFTAAALVMLGTGVGLSAAVGPAPRRR